MRKFVLILGAASLVAGPLALPTDAHASCESRRTTGTVIGAVAGGLVGDAVTHGGGRLGGTLIGAGLGGFAGHEIAGAGCHRYYRHARYERRRIADRYASTEPGPPGAPPSRCATQEQNYYDERGQLVQRPTQVCQ